MKTFNTILTLRRDNDYNYAKVKESFIPANGEVCLVDTSRSGLRAVIGDGKTPFSQLSFFDEIFLKGYYLEGQFYKDNHYLKVYEPLDNKLYIDIAANILYYYNGEEYQKLSGSGGAIETLPTATSKIPGVMKIYNAVGQNTDGTMTQKAITDELNEKFEITLSPEEELVIFTND